MPAGIPDDGGGGDGGPTGDVASEDVGTAHFVVDVESGSVTVTHSRAAEGVMEAAAAFSGTAVNFDSTVLYDQPGDTGLKVLDVSLTNRMGFAIGQSPDGTEIGVRVQFSDIIPLATPADRRSQSRVSTLASVSGNPNATAVGTDGSVYVTVPHRVLKISRGAVSVLAGDTSAGYVNRVGAAARFNGPIGIAVNPVDGALIVAEMTGNRIRRIDEFGSATLVAGTGTAGSADGAGDVAQFSDPTGVAVDAAGNIYVADSNRVRKIRYTGTNPMWPNNYTVSTLAGSSSAGYADSNGTGARFDAPRGVAVDEDGNVYVADAGNRRIRMVQPDGRVSTVAGTGSWGAVDGDGDVAKFKSPRGIVCLPDRGRGPALIVADSEDHTLRQVSLKSNGTAGPGGAANWSVQTVAGASGVSGTTDGAGSVARLNSPRLLCSDESGNLYVPDYSNSSVRVATANEGFFPIGTPDGGATTENVQLANADGWVPWSGGSNRPFINYPAIGRGASSDPQIWAFSVPSGVTAFEFSVLVSAATEMPTPPEGVDGDTSGNKGSSRVMVRTLAGSTTGVNGFIDGGGANARFRCIVGLDFDSEGNAFVADSENNAIRRVTPDGTVSTVAGSAGTGGYVNGRGNVAQLNYPCDVVVVEDGMLSATTAVSTTPATTYILFTDLDNDRIRIVRAPHSTWDSSLPEEPWNAGFYEVSLVAGDGTSAYNDGLGTVARFSAPDSIAMGPGGVFYVLERGGGNRVRTLRWLGGDPTNASNWAVSLLAGATDGSAGYVNGTGSAARFDDPRGIAVGPDGMVYVADTCNDCIRQITPDGVVSTLAGTNSSGYVDATGATARFYRPWAVCVGPDGYIYVADRYNYRIRRVSPSGVVTTVAGTGSSTRLDGPGNTSGHQDDLGIAINQFGDLYIGEAECLRVIERIIDVGDAG